MSETPKDEPPIASSTGQFAAGEVVMPFVLVESAGGEFDDLAFVSGYECGLIDGRLEALGEWCPIVIFQIHEQSRPQVDLIAMKRGFQAEFTQPAAGWVYAQLTLAGTKIFKVSDAGEIND